METFEIITDLALLAVVSFFIGLCIGLSLNNKNIRVYKKDLRCQEFTKQTL